MDPSIFFGALNVTSNAVSPDCQANRYDTGSISRRITGDKVFIDNRK